MAARDHKDLKLPRKCMVAEEELEGGRDKETRSARLQKCSVAPSSLEKPPEAIMGHWEFLSSTPGPLFIFCPGDGGDEGELQLNLKICSVRASPVVPASASGNEKWLTSRTQI